MQTFYCFTFIQCNAVAQRANDDNKKTTAELWYSLTQQGFKKLHSLSKFTISTAAARQVGFENRTICKWPGRRDMKSRCSWTEMMFCYRGLKSFYGKIGIVCRSRNVDPASLSPLQQLNTEVACRVEIHRSAQFNSSGGRNPSFCAIISCDPSFRSFLAKIQHPNGWSMFLTRKPRCGKVIHNKSSGEKFHISAKFLKKFPCIISEKSRFKQVRRTPSFSREFARIAYSATIFHKILLFRKPRWHTHC